MASNSVCFCNLKFALNSGWLINTVSITTDDYGASVVPSPDGYYPIAITPKNYIYGAFLSGGISRVYSITGSSPEAVMNTNIGDVVVLYAKR